MASNFLHVLFFYPTSRRNKACKAIFPQPGFLRTSLSLAQLTHVYFFKRVTFIYGLLWDHASLNSLTHETIHEIFGYYSIKSLNQLTLAVKSQKIVSYSGENIYLPDVDKKERLKSPDYLEKIGHLDFPITFIAGEPVLVLLCAPRRPPESGVSLNCC